MITVRSSPWPQDEDLPWEYEDDDFLSWFNEVFVDDDDPEITDIEEALDHLIDMDYSVSYRKD